MFWNGVFKSFHAKVNIVDLFCRILRGAVFPFIPSLHHQTFVLQ